MKKITFLKSLVLAAILLVGSSNAFAETITITGADLTTTDEAQSFTKSGIEFGGFMKQYNTDIVWFTKGTGYIYNVTSLGSIDKITLSYNVGGSASAKQMFSAGATAFTEYVAADGTEVLTSSGGTTYDYVEAAGKGFFNISVSNKNMQLVSLVIDYTPGTTAIEQVTSELSVYANNGKIYGAENARIYTILGMDVTEQNGSLKGIYVVKVGNKTQKIAVK